MLPAFTTPAVALGLGGLALTANSYFFLGNTVLADLGVVPIISKEEKRQKYQLSMGKSTEIFDFFYHAAAARFAPAAMVAGLGYLSSAFLLRNEASSRLTTRLLCLAGALSLFIPPYTVFVMFPTNKRIVAKGKRSEKGDPEVNNKEVAESSQKDLDSWLVMNGVRIASSGLGYFVGLYALLQWKR